MGLLFEVLSGNFDLWRELRGRSSLNQLRGQKIIKKCLLCHESDQEGRKVASESGLQARTKSSQGFSSERPFADTTCNRRWPGGAKFASQFVLLIAAGRGRLASPRANGGGRKEVTFSRNILCSLCLQSPPRNAVPQIESRR